MIELLFAGDLIPPDSKEKIYSESLLNVLRDKDLSVVNLETPLTASSDKIIKTGRNFKSSPDGISAIKNGYFDAVALANNHIRDFGDEGIKDTLRVFSNNKILTVGAGVDLEEASNPLRINIKGIRISILNYCETEFNLATQERAGANPYDTIQAYYDITGERSINDFVFVIYHGGLEYSYYPTPEIVKRFKFMADAGADSIISHHTHRYSGVLNHNGKQLFLGLGNFLASTVNKSELSDWRIGVIVKLSIDNRIIKHELIPVKMSNDFKKIELVEGGEKNSIITHICEISDKIKDQNYLEKFWNQEDVKYSKRTLSLISSNSRFEYRLSKYLPFLSDFKSSEYKLLNILGLIQNDSNRQRLIRTIERMLLLKNR